MKKIMVLGATGRIGKLLLPLLSKQGNEVTAYIRNFKKTTGEIGKMLNELCKEMPEYVQAADMIAASGISYTLIRAAHLTDGTNVRYYVQNEGEALHTNSVDRISVAHFIADLIANHHGINESLGVTN